jgi:hypothetical protein
LKFVKDWWDGKYVPHENTTHVVFIGGGKRKWHWTALAARAVVTFLTRHWQWAAGFALAAVGVWKH